jgi:hypothetical protein
MGAKEERAQNGAGPGGGRPELRAYRQCGLGKISDSRFIKSALIFVDLRINTPKPFIPAVNLSDEERALLARAASWTGPERTLEELTPERLAGLTRNEGLDFATALLYDRILRVPANMEFLESARRGGPSLRLGVDLIAVAPGAFHRESGETGAGGMRMLEIAKNLGCEGAVIPTPEFSTLDESAALVLDWIEAHRDRRIGLISLSKGSADVKRALSKPGADRAFAAVYAWISLSGMANGTPAIGWLRRHPLHLRGVRLWLRWKGHRAGALDDMDHCTGGGAPAAWPAMPPHLRVYHASGFPLKRHLMSDFARRAHAGLAELGPTDGGGVFLGDFVGAPGIVCPIWGADHYLRPAWDVMPLLQGIVAAALAAEGENIPQGRREAEVR